MNEGKMVSQEECGVNRYKFKSTLYYFFKDITLEELKTFDLLKFMYLHTVTL